jgi:hypothetical protein
MNPIIQIEQERKRIQSKQTRPVRDLSRILDLRVSLDPLSDLSIAGSSRYEFFEFGRIDLGESEKDLIHRAIKMVITRFTGEFSPALVQHSCSQSAVSAKWRTRALRSYRSEIRRELKQSFFGHRKVVQVQNIGNTIGSKHR